MRTIYLKWVQILLCMSLTLFITSCTHKAVQPPPVCSDNGFNYLQQQINGIGGQFSELGNEVLIDLPTYYLFEGDSRNITPASGVLLGRVADRLNCYPTQAVSVTVFTGTLCWPTSNLSLARQRAKLMADILRTYGISRLIYEKAQSIPGYGANCTQNRIEIVTKKLT